MIIIVVVFKLNQSETTDWKTGSRECWSVSHRKIRHHSSSCNSRPSLKFFFCIWEIRRTFLY